MKKGNIILFFLIVIQTQFISAQTKIIMQRNGGVFTVPCEVNGLKLRFIFDTGASAVSISLTEALFMLKNGHLNEKDINGSSYAQLANGEITKNTKIVLREIKFSGYVIRNVEAYVIHELGAPLLLGQSAMKQIGTFQFNPNNGILTIINGKQEENSLTENSSGFYDTNNWTILANLNKFKTGRSDSPFESSSKSVYKKQGVFNLPLLDINEREETNEITLIERGEIFIIEKNVIRVYNPFDYGTYYFYYVYYNGYLGFVENRYLDEY